MNETWYKQQAVKQVKNSRGYATRIEDKFRVGFPDILAIVDGFVCFLEFKVVEHRSFGPTPRQHLELRRIAEAGGVSFVVGCKDRVFYICEPRERCSIDEPVAFGPDFAQLLREVAEKRRSEV